MEEASSWLCFRDDNGGSKQEDDEWEETTDENAAPDQPHLQIATGEKPYLAPPKVGRNDACPCGSGRKYKKCCSAN